MAIVRSEKTGKIIAKRFTVEELEAADDMQEGFCIACGASKDSCEPDARKYQCEECGLKQVYGASEIAIMGLTKE